ncbi:hypothetical protein [Paenibacillus tepidiphilus]|nr:hypothetical protein [Paenibacillus tepidiphilus]
MRRSQPERPAAAGLPAAGWLPQTLLLQGLSAADWLSQAAAAGLPAAGWL